MANDQKKPYEGGRYADFRSGDFDLTPAVTDWRKRIERLPEWYGVQLRIQLGADLELVEKALGAGELEDAEKRLKKVQEDYHTASVYGVGEEVSRREIERNKLTGERLRQTVTNAGQRYVTLVSQLEALRLRRAQNEEGIGALERQIEKQLAELAA